MNKQKFTIGSRWREIGWRKDGYAEVRNYDGNGFYDTNGMFWLPDLRKFIPFVIEEVL